MIIPRVQPAFYIAYIRDGENQNLPVNINKNHLVQHIIQHRKNRNSREHTSLLYRIVYNLFL